MSKERRALRAQRTFGVNRPKGESGSEKSPQVTFGVNRESETGLEKDPLEKLSLPGRGGL